MRDRFVRRLATVEPIVAAEIAIQLSDENLLRLSTTQVASLRKRLELATELRSLQEIIVGELGGQPED